MGTGIAAPIAAETWNWELDLFASFDNTNSNRLPFPICRLPFPICN